MFPITPHTCIARTESPLRVHYNPQAVSKNSLEDFLDRFLPPLSFFARRISQGNRHVVMALRRGVFLDPSASLKAGYSAHSTKLHRKAGSIPVSSTVFAPRYQVGSPRKLGRGSHAVASRPKSLTSSNSPNLGKRSHHQKLQRCALRRYFNPVSERWNLTRILCHHLYYYIKTSKNVKYLRDY